MRWGHRVFEAVNKLLIAESKGAHGEVERFKEDKKELARERLHADSALVLTIRDRDAAMAEIARLTFLLGIAREEIQRFDETYAAHLARENKITRVRKALERLANEAEGLLRTGDSAADGRTNRNALKRRSGK